MSFRGLIRELAPAGQLAMPWEPAQLGLDGVAYAIPPPSVEINTEVDVAALQARSERQLWLDGVELGTLPFRIKQAGRHRNQAAAARQRGKLLTASWHESRADGVRRRFENIRRCCAREMRRTLACGCGAGTCQTVTQLRCSDWKSCTSCRGKRSRAYRGRFRGGRRAALSRYKFARRGGRWGEKFLTLTCPHVGQVDERMRDIKGAYPRFLRFIRRHLELDRRVPRKMTTFPYVHVLECTCGDDFQGHPHLHVWLVVPFIPHELLRLYWARALGDKYIQAMPTRSRAEVLGDARNASKLAPWLVTRRGKHGRELGELPWPVVDVRKAENVEEELIKYLVKDSAMVDGKRRYVDLDAYVKIYVAYSGRRSISASRGFWPARAGPAHCQQCGSCDWTSRVYERGEIGDAIGRAVAAMGAFAQSEILQ